MRLSINRAVFLTSATLILLFVVLGAILGRGLEAYFAGIQNFIVDKLGFVYILAVAGFLIFCVWLFFSPYGTVRLGGDEEEPEYSRTTWFAMLFSAGMGIGLLFFSVAEPISHFANPPEGEGLTVEAARRAIDLTFFHWGVHAWGVYIVVGLSLAYFAYRHHLPLTIRSSFYPLLGKRIYGRIGDTVEILAVFGTLFGVATSLGLGAQQINAGLSGLGLLDYGTSSQIWLIAGITMAATASVISGLDMGIRRLSELSLLLGCLLLLTVLWLGPTTFLIDSFVESVGRYFQNLIRLTFDTHAYVGSQWQKDWTLFYWGWWISWSPFVGMFIARISRGRTIREFILGALLVPTLLTGLWMVVFGNSAIFFELNEAGAGIVGAVQESIPSGLFVLLAKLPLAGVTTVLAVMVIGIYFVTSSDSASLVIDILTSDGDPNPPVAQRVFWALLEGAVATVLLLTGGLVALQTAAITTALPFAVVIAAMCWSLAKALRRERQEWPAGLPPALQQIGGGLAALEGESEGGEDEEEAGRDDQHHWRKRLSAVIETRDAQAPGAYQEAAEAYLQNFLGNEVRRAFRDVEGELKRYGRMTRVKQGKHEITLVVLNGEKEEFVYTVRGHAYHKMRFAFPDVGRRGLPDVYRAEVLLPGGREEERDIRYWTRAEIVENFVREYEKWLGWMRPRGR